MFILNICRGGVAKLYFTKQPRLDLFRKKKKKIIDCVQEKQGFQNKTCEQIILKSFNRLCCFLSTFFFRVCNDDNKGLSWIQYDLSPKCPKILSNIGPGHQGKYIKLLALCFHVLIIRGI